LQNGFQKTRIETKYSWIWIPPLFLIVAKQLPENTDRNKICSAYLLESDNCGYALLQNRLQQNKD
jgi:hypothetical protein